MKSAAEKSYVKGTGGGPPPPKSKKLDVEDENIAAILGVSATGLDHDLDEDFRFSPGTHSVLG
jgi:hypothetical protein